MRLSTLAAALLAGSPSLAAVVTDCDRPEANARNIARPVTEAARDFSNGEVTLMQLLLDEPACCGAHLMILWPDPEVGYARCAFVTSDDGLGWSGLDMGAATATYDPARGLRVAVPGQRWVADGDAYLPFVLDVTLDRAAGKVGASERPGGAEAGSE